MLPIVTPYDAVESIYWLIKYVIGPSKRNVGIVKQIPNTYVLNKNIKPRYTLAFVGDIMPTGKRSVHLSSDLKEFLSDSDYLIANFEGIITQRQKKAFSDCRHNKNIIQTLSEVFLPQRTYLSISNNHAGDFGKEEYFNSVKILESQNFNVCGWKQRPYLDINDSIRIISGTMWSNRECDYVFMLDNVLHHIKPGVFNILYPHFGYEHELYPRPKIVTMAKELIIKFDAILGHHSHCPQPVTVESVNGFNKLLAYSLGNFLSARKIKKYQQGIALKAQLGQSQDSKWLLGNVEWRFTRCCPLSNGDFMLSLIK